VHTNLRRFRLLPLLCCAFVSLLAVPALAADTFLESDDFKEGEEIVNVFLGEEEYAIMVEEFTRNGQEFDWGWALTPDWNAAPASAEQGGGMRGRMRRRSGPKLDANPKQLGFALSDYKTVHVPEIANHAGIVKPEELAQVRDALVAAVGEMGLTLADSEDKADLVLEAALVDLGREGGGFGLIQVQPFIELEVRLRERGGRALFLARTQKHAREAFDASLTLASQVALALR
jgi:hypothetical protein